MKAARSDNVIDVTVRIDLKEAVGRFDEIVRMLEERGLSDTLPHPRLGIVNGSVPAAQLAGLREVTGVASVRANATYRTQPG